MGSNPVVALALTSATSSLTPDDSQNNLPFPSAKAKPFVASPFQSLHVLDAAPPMHRCQQNNLRFNPISSVAPPYLYPGQDGYAPPVPSRYTPGQHTSREASGLLDTRQWTPFLSLAAFHATSGTHFPPTLMAGSQASPDVLPNGFTGSFSPDSTLGRGMAPVSQAIAHSQAILNLSLGFPRSTGLHHASLGTNVSVPQLPPGYQSSIVHHPDHPAFATSNVVPLPSPGSTEDVAGVIPDEFQPSLVICRPLQNKGSGRRRSQRTYAINIEGFWIDKDDLFAGARQSGGMIHVHECRWAMSSNPCGMWIVGSRSRVGVHIRNWHPESHSNSAVKCLWDGCTTSKAIRKNSTNRHVVTVHLEEAFHCQGCSQVFPRKDVYDNHVKSGEVRVCRDADVVVVYGTEHRMIDARQALQRGFSGDAVRYPG